MAKLEPVADEVIAFQGKMLEIVHQQMGDGTKTVLFEWARRTPGIRLIIVDLKNENVLLTKEYRYELGTDDYRLPGGKVFDSLSEYNQFLKSGQNAFEASIQKAKEEALEEAGVKVDELSHFHTSKYGSSVEWDLFYFVATNWQKAEQQLGHGEEISTEMVSFAKAKELALSGKISEERSALVLLRYLATVSSI